MSVSTSLRKALKDLLLLVDHETDLPEGAANGVTNPNGHDDEGVVRASEIIGKARELTEGEAMSDGMVCACGQTENVQPVCEGCLEVRDMLACKPLKEILAGILDTMGALSNPSELEGIGLEMTERHKLEEFIRDHRD